MIAVQGYKGQKVAVLGLGRSGTATARALEAGGATALCWDDSPESRDRAAAAGLSPVAMTTSMGRTSAVWAMLIFL